MSAPSLLGRSHELEQLLAAIEPTRLGAGGSLQFVCGEPGIGKSRLADEVGRAAASAGVHVLWGRAWEAGGAPAYWPWIQVLRELLAGADGAALVQSLPRARLAPLAALLPELLQHTGAQSEGSTLAPEQARFALLDAACALLLQAARRRPRLLVLEDLHAADPASIELLDFVGGQARGVPLALLGTYREVDAARAPWGAALARIASRARAFALRRLSPDEVARQLEQLTFAAPSPALVAAVHAATEGNPLFVAETARLLQAHATDPGKLAVPGSVRAAIRARLAELAAGTREVLELAAVIGREFRAATLARMAGRSASELAPALADAVDAAVLLELEAGSYRFAHILLREVLHQDLERERRERLHLALAETLAADSERAPLSEFAHHYLEAGPAGRERAIESALAAAQQAEQQFAFGDAARLLELALGAAEGGAAGPATRAIELRVAIGRAKVLAGELAAGRAYCLEAAERARRAGKPTLLAQAGLAYGAVFVAAKVDPELVRVLREALQQLDPNERSLRARVMARLAAAMQPASDPREPIALAHAAIALGREHGDPATLLEVLRAACSALVDLGDPHERIALNREHVALAERLGDRVEMLRGTVRLVFDCYELGDVAGARAGIDRAERIGGELGHPHYVWRIASMQAMRAAFAGDFAQAERELERAAALGKSAGDPNVSRSLLVQRLGLLRQQARSADLLALVPEAQREFAGEEASLHFLALIVRSTLLRVGAGPEPGDTAHAEFGLALGDQASLEHVSEVTAAAGDRELAARVAERVRAAQTHFAHGGMLGMTWDGPLSRALGLLEWTLGRREQAERCLQDAIERSRALGSRTHLAWAAFDLGRFLRAHGEAGRAAETLRVARELGAELELRDLVVAIDALGAAAKPALGTTGGQPRPARGAGLRMERDGELWLLASGERSFRLKDGKGLRMLAELVREPGRERHVLELSEPGGASDTGDAGELLDTRARAGYRARIDVLRGEIAEAEAHNDLGRAERSRRELELLGQELARAVGLGGRGRTSGAAAERARVNVQRRLRDAIRRIGEQDADLARHLERCLRTGTFCSYDPD